MAETQQIPRLAYAAEALTNFLGVNLRRDPLSIQETDVVRAINADLHSQVGSVLLRKGRTLLTQGYEGAVRLIQRLDGSRWVIADTTLSNGIATIVTGLDASLRTSLLAMRPLNDTQTWVFIADESGMRKSSGSGTTTWGIVAPTATPVCAAGASSSLSTVCTVVYTYARLTPSGAIAHESNPSSASLSFTATNSNIVVTNLVDSTDSQVTHKRIYRTVNGGSAWLLDQTIAQGVTTATLSIADTALGAVVDQDNDPPPVSFHAIRHQEHVFFLDAANPSYLWWSKRYRPESRPLTNFIDIGSVDDPFNVLVPMAGLLGAFTRTTKYRIFGNATSGFVHQEALSSRGTPAPQAVLVTEKGCLFPARDGLFLTNFTQEDSELSQLIAPLFEGIEVNGYAPINWTAASTMALAYWKQRLYFAYPSGDHTSPDMVAVYSFHTQQWYFWHMGIRSLYFEETTDALLAGTDGGDVYQLEHGRSDGGERIALIFEPATRSMQSQGRKRFDYMRVDADVPSGVLRCAVYIDDVLIALVMVTGRRTQPLIRLNHRMGIQWRVVFTYRGTETVSIHGVEMQATPLRAH